MYAVTVRDTGTNSQEFAIASEEVQGGITVTVSDACGDATLPDAGVDSQGLDSGYHTDAESILDSGDSDAERFSDSGDSDAERFSDSGDSDALDTEAGTTAEGCTTNCPDLQWVEIPGGTFPMGRPDNGLDVTLDVYRTEHPRHEVTVRSFKITKTEVTVAQYRKCVDAGVCNEPLADDYDYNNWSRPDRENHPINGLLWSDAKAFAEWVGARLPSEAEWEYAARGRGEDIIHPWGVQDLTCEHAVFRGAGDLNCDTVATSEVCSKPLGHTAQDLCDMVGNVVEYVEDDWHDNYNGAPNDSSPWIHEPRDEYRAMRGGSWVSSVASACTTFVRFRYSPDAPDFERFTQGFRLASDL